MMWLSFVIVSLLAFLTELGNAQRQQPCAVDNALPLPAGASCAFLGRLMRPNILLSTTATGLQCSCAAACLGITGCESFSFTPSTRQCVLFRSSLRAQGMRTDPATGAYHWNRNCFTTRGSCPAPLPLPTSTVTATSVSTQTVTFTAVPKRATVTIQRVVSTETSVMTLAAQTVTLPPETHTITTPGPATTVTIAGEEDAPEPVTITETSISISTQAAQCDTSTSSSTSSTTATATSTTLSSSSSTSEISTTSSTTTSSTLTTSSSSTTSSSLTTSSSSTTTTTSKRPDPTPAQVQVVRDGSFEQFGADPNSSPWRAISGAQVLNGQAKEGQYKAQFKLDFVTQQLIDLGSDLHSDGTMYQDVNTIVGKVYTLTYWTYVPDKGCFFCNLLVRQNGKEFSQANFGEPVLNDQGFPIDVKPSTGNIWKKITGTFTAETRLTRLEFYARHGFGLGGGDIIWVDDVQLTADADSDEAQCSVTSRELVKDGSFEGAVWNYPDGRAYRGDGVPVKSGSRAATFQMPQQANVAVGPITQQLTGLVTGQTATLKFWYNMPGTTGNTDITCAIRPQLDGADLAVIQLSSQRGSSLPTFFRGTTDYLLSSIQFTPNSETVVLGFTGSCLAFFTGAGYRMFVDDVSVQQAAVSCP